MSCTFATLFDILYQGQNSTPKMSKPGFLDIMIPVLDDEGARFQELHKSYISHMFSGAERFPVNVAHFYEKENQFEALKERFRNKILPMLEFPEVTLAKIRNEIETDPYMLTAKKEQLLSLYDDAAAFLTAVLRYTMSTPLKQLPQNESLDLCQIILGHKPPKPCEGFCGRENELKEMHDVLSTHKRVFLSGIAGLGKSEIMAAYASNHSKDYSNIIWLRCAESLHKSIQKLTVKGNPYEYSAEEAYHYRDQLLRALPENALLILDSVDWPSYDDPVLQDMLINYNCHIAVTTRCPVDDDPVVTVGPIRCDEDRFQIMRSIFKDADAHQKTIEKIIAELDYHTMAIVLAASLLQNSQLSPELLLRNIYKRNLIQDFKDRILLKRVQERRMARYSDHIKLLFRLSQLSEAEKQVLCGLVVMPVDGIREQIFAPLMLINDLSDVHRLVDLGYIRRNEDRHLALYSLIGETVQTEIGLDMSRLKNLYQAVDAVLRQQWRWKLLDPCVVEDIVEHLAQLTCPECQAENRVIYL